MKPIFIIPMCTALSAFNSNLYSEVNFAYGASPTTYEYTKQSSRACAGLRLFRTTMTYAGRWMKLPCPRHW